MVTEVTIENVGSGGNASQEQEIPPLEYIFDIVVDLGLRKPIDEYDVNIKDVVRKEYLLRDPCQKNYHAYPLRNGKLSDKYS